jgi:hypothetical protein
MKLKGKRHYYRRDILALQNHKKSKPGIIPSKPHISLFLKIEISKAYFLCFLLLFCHSELPVFLISRSHRETKGVQGTSLLISPIVIIF